MADARDRRFDRIGLIGLVARYPPGTRFLTGGVFGPERIGVVTSADTEPAFPGLRAPGAPAPPPGPPRLFVRYYYEDDPNQISHRSRAGILDHAIVPDQGQGNAQDMNGNGGGGKRRKSQKKHRKHRKHRKRTLHKRRR